MEEVSYVAALSPAILSHPLVDPLKSGGAAPTMLAKASGKAGKLQAGGQMAFKALRGTVRAEGDVVSQRLRKALRLFGAKGAAEGVCVSGRPVLACACARVR